MAALDTHIAPDVMVAIAAILTEGSRSHFYCYRGPVATPQPRQRQEKKEDQRAREGRGARAIIGQLSDLRQ